MAITHEERHEELLPGLVMGLLDLQERVVVESHIVQGCTVCDREHTAWCNLVAAIALAVAVVAPSAATRARVMGVTHQSSDGSRP